MKSDIYSNLTLYGMGKKAYFIASIRTASTSSKLVQSNGEIPRSNQRGFRRCGDNGRGRGFGTAPTRSTPVLSSERMICLINSSMLPMLYHILAHCSEGRCVLSFVDKKKLHYIGWETFCEDKQKGGAGRRWQKALL